MFPNFPFGHLPPGLWVPLLKFPSNQNNIICMQTRFVKKYFKNNRQAVRKTSTNQLLNNWRSWICSWAQLQNYWWIDFIRPFRVLAWAWIFFRNKSYYWCRKNQRIFHYLNVTSSRHTQQETVLGHGTFHHENGTFWSFNSTATSCSFPLPGPYASAFERNGIE